MSLQADFLPPPVTFKAIMTVLPIAYADPVGVFAPYAETPWAMLLDCPADDPIRGRYAYIAVDPSATLLGVGGAVLVNGAPSADDPFLALSKLLAAAPKPDGDFPTPFCGGAVGVMGYELGRYIERAPASHVAANTQPEIAIGLYDCIIAFDRVDHKAWVIGQGERGAAKAEILTAGLKTGVPPLAPPAAIPETPWIPEISQAVYLDKVARVIDYIHAGDIFQANFTQRFLAARPPGLDAFALYRTLRAVNPAPFAAFLNVPGMILASASPERFMQVSAQGQIETRPIKGTRRRSPDPMMDGVMAAELLASVKDRAENLMITDLLRNDIGRVAVIGSVRAPTVSGLESFASVHHLVSVIEGQLRLGMTVVDLLKASFPGGSITGAPKVRAMEIIDELEVAPRGAYCGSVLWIGFDGAMDSNIVIRSLVLTADNIITQAGGGIVADSSPIAEWQEMMDKATPALSVLKGPLS